MTSVPPQLIVQGSEEEIGLLNIEASFNGNLTFGVNMCSLFSIKYPFWDNVLVRPVR